MKPLHGGWRHSAANDPLLQLAQNLHCDPRECTQAERILKQSLQAF